MESTNLGSRRVSGSYGRYRIEREPSAMYVSDDAFRCVGFVAELAHSDSTGEEYDSIGTGFFVSVPSVEAGSFCYFVTAKHVVRELRGKESRILVNRKSGGTMSLPVHATQWWFHESDNSADVAVLPFTTSREMDVIFMNIKDLVKRSELQSVGVGIGDEVYIVGLFTFAPGQQRNMPIVRHGNVAMIPDEQIQTEDGFADVYLIETRSIGGLSGSPVFVRETVILDGKKESGEPAKFRGLGRAYLLGLMQGHWDIKESEINKPYATHDSRLGVNMGIGIVVPSDKIIDIINRPELKIQREEHEARIRQARIPKPDTSSD